MKQETLEEFSKRISNDEANKKYYSLDYQDGIFYGIEIGAKWQQERMYSEEDMRIAYLTNSNHLGTFEDFIKLF